MNRLLVVGVDTLAGAGVAQALSDRRDVWGISFQSGVGGPNSRYVRRGDSAALSAAVDAIEPDWLIYAGSLSAGNWDLPMSDPAWEQETAIAECLVASCRRRHARLTALSSDAVFAGPKMFHEESEPSASTHPAAAAILRWEQILIAADALVARTHVYGWAADGVAPGFVERIAQSLLDGTQPTVDGWRYATPILAADLAELLLRAADRNLTGLYHLSGAERTNSFRLANELAVILGAAVPRNLKIHLTPPESGWLLETTLDSRRARRALGMPLPMLAEGLQRFAQQATCSEHDSPALAQQAA